MEGIKIGETRICLFRYREDLCDKPVYILSKLYEREDAFLCRLEDGSTKGIHKEYLGRVIYTLSKEERLLARHKTTWNKSKYVLAHPSQAY